jgi:beta-phosphoglucomutase-like phosphatase (HAD superfamily)
VSAPRAVILDFNGTLSDDEPLLDRLFRDALAVEAGIEMTSADYFEQFAGLSDPEIAESALRAGGIDPSPALIERILRAKIDGYLIAVEEEPPIPHAATEFVDVVADRVPIAIASGAFRIEVESVLELSGIRDRFDAVVCIDDVESGKPDPEGYLLAHERMNEANGSAIAAAHVLAIEDSAAGVAAAQQAGLRCAAVAGDARAAEVADFTIDRLDAATAERLFGRG